MPETREKFLQFINSGKPPVDYEKQLLKKYFPRVQSVLRGENPPPYELEIQPSSTCNAHCTHCWARGFQKLPEKLYSQRAMHRIISQALEFRSNGFQIDTIKFCGSTGDPLMNPQTLYAVGLVAGKRYIRFFTNGIKLAENKGNQEYLRILSGINRFNLSLDAGTTGTLHKIKTGSAHIELEHILEAIAALRLMNPKMDVEASYVITNQNYHEISEFVRKVKESRAANRVKFRIDMTDRQVSVRHGRKIVQELEKAVSQSCSGLEVVPVHSEEEMKTPESSSFSSRDQGFKCFTSRFWSCIGPDANLYPCGHIVSPETQSFGSLLDNDFADVWHSKARSEQLGCLPGEKCSICSPSSLRTNHFLTWLDKIPAETTETLYRSHISMKTECTSQQFTQLNAAG